jgi:archaemetzincin
VIDDQVAVCRFCQPDQGRHHLLSRADGINHVNPLVQREVGGVEIVQHERHIDPPIGFPDIGAEDRPAAFLDREGGFKIISNTNFGGIGVAGRDICPDSPFNTFMSTHSRVMVMLLLIFWDSAAQQGISLPVSRIISGLVGIPVKVSANPIVLNGYVGARHQTDAGAVLDTIDRFRQREGVSAPVLLVCDTDLFAEGFSSLFGLARPSTGSAVVSVTRLNNLFYGRNASDEDLTDRIVKEGAHEVGHLLGLDHCRDEVCIMHNPFTLDDMDRKRRGFCHACQVLLESGIAGTIEAVRTDIT